MQKELTIICLGLTMLGCICCASSQDASTVQPASSDAAEPSDADSANNTVDAAPSPTPELDGVQAAIVTRACMYEDYAYAIDILLSCGDERFGEELRLHTFKRHSYAHRQVFNDQLITYRNQQLWFDAYNPKRCVQMSGEGQLLLTSDNAQCTKVQLMSQNEKYFIKDATTGLCAGLGDSQCLDHSGTGGDECGGIDHRYLPLEMGACSQALEFSFVTQADACGDEYPDEECF